MLDRFLFEAPDDELGIKAAQALISQLDDDKKLGHLRASIHVEIAPLSFYENTELYRLTVSLENIDYQAFYVWSGRANFDEHRKGPVPKMIHLNGTSPPIHELNAATPIRLPAPRFSDEIVPKEVIDYLHFFCFMVNGDEGPFLILESVSDLPDLPISTSSEVKNLSDIAEKLNMIKRVSYEETLSDEKTFNKPSVNTPMDRWLMKSHVTYNGALFEALFAVHLTGMIDMIDDKVNYSCQISQKIWHQELPGIQGIRWFRTGLPQYPLNTFKFTKAHNILRDELLELTEFEEHVTEPSMLNRYFLKDENNISHNEQNKNIPKVEVTEPLFLNDVELYRITLQVDENFYCAFFLWSGQQIIENIVPNNRPAPFPIPLSGAYEDIEMLNDVGAIIIPKPENDPSAKAKETIRQFTHFTCALASVSSRIGTTVIEKPSDLPGLCEQLLISPISIDLHHPLEIAVIEDPDKEKNILYQDEQNNQPSENQDSSSKHWLIKGIYADGGTLCKFSQTINPGSDTSKLIKYSWKSTPLQTLPRKWQIWCGGLAIPEDNSESPQDTSNKEENNKSAILAPAENNRWGYWYTVGPESSRPEKNYKSKSLKSIHLVTLPTFWKMITDESNTGIISNLRIINPESVSGINNNFKTIVAGLSLENIEFRCKAELQRLKVDGHLLYHNCDFTEGLDMFSSEINGSLGILGCTHKSNLSLLGSSINGRLYIRFDKYTNDKISISLSSIAVEGDVEIWSRNKINRVHYNAIDLNSAIIKGDLNIFDLYANYFRGSACQVGGHIFLHKVSSREDISITHSRVGGYTYILECQCGRDISLRGLRCAWLAIEAQKPDCLDLKNSNKAALKVSCNLELAEDLHKKWITGKLFEDSDYSGRELPSGMFDVGRNIDISHIVVDGPVGIGGLHVRGSIFGRGGRVNSLTISSLLADPPTEAVSTDKATSAKTGEKKGSDHPSSEGPRKLYMEHSEVSKPSQETDKKVSEDNIKESLSSTNQDYNLQVRNDETDTNINQYLSQLAYTDLPKPYRECFIGLGTSFINFDIDSDLIVSMRCDSEFADQVSFDEPDTPEDDKLRVTHPIGQHLLKMIMISCCSVGRRICLCGHMARITANHDALNKYGSLIAESSIQPSPLLAPRGIRIEHTNAGADIDLRDLECNEGDIVLNNVSAEGSLRLDSIQAYTPECDLPHITRTKCRNLRVQGMACSGSALLGGLITNSLKSSGLTAETGSDSIEIFLLKLQGNLKCQSKPTLLFSNRKPEDEVDSVMMECGSSAHLAAVDVAGHLDLRGVRIRNNLRLDDISVGRDVQAGTHLDQKFTIEPTCIGRSFSATELRCEGDLVLTNLEVGNPEQEQGRIRSFALTRSEIKGLVKLVHRPGRLPYLTEAYDESALIRGSIHFNYSVMNQLYISEKNIVHCDDLESKEPTPIKLEEATWHPTLFFEDKTIKDVYFVFSRAKFDLLHMRLNIDSNGYSRPQTGYDISEMEVGSWEFYSSENAPSSPDDRELTGKQLIEAFKHILKLDRKGLRKTYASCESWLNDRDENKAAEQIRRLMYERQIHNRRHFSKNALSDTRLLERLRSKLHNLVSRFLYRFGYGRFIESVLCLVLLTIGTSLFFWPHDHIVPSHSALEVSGVKYLLSSEDVSESKPSNLDISTQLDVEDTAEEKEAQESIANRESAAISGEISARTNPELSDWSWNNALLMSLRHTLPMISLEIQTEWRPSPYKKLMFFGPLKIFVSIETIASIATVLAWIVWIFILISAAGLLKRVRLSMTN